MTLTADQPVTDIVRISRDTDAHQLGVAVYDDLFDLLAGLSPEDWQARTECPDWTVRDMVGHLTGAAEAYGSIAALVRQQAWARRHRERFDGNDLDAANAHQVRRYADLAPDELLATLRRLAPRSVARRMQLPGLVRRIRVPVAPTGSTAPGMPATLSMGHLYDTVLTRDVWLHRVDIARATDRPLPLDADVDGRIVADAVAEWATRHGSAFRLQLSGPAGGSFRHGEGGPRLELDAVEFCRVLSGRTPGHGLLATRILF